MSVQPVNLLLGTGELYIKKYGSADGKFVRVGNLKGSVSFAYEEGTVEQKPGNRTAVTRRDITTRSATLSASVCDFKVAQLITALGLSTSTTGLTQTTTLRVFEELSLGSTTATKTLARTCVSVTSVKVEKADTSQVLVAGTDYTMATKFGIAPKSASIANKAVMVSYDVADKTATRVRIGDNSFLQEVALKFSHKLSSGKFINIIMPRATIMGGLTIPFNEDSYTMYNVQFKALSDTTLASNLNLFKIVREV